MATKRKSIIEEALLEAKTLEDALKANTKEMLSAHMKKEIESIVESSLKEDEEEVEELIDVQLGSDEETDVPALEVGDSSEEEIDADADIDLDELELDLNLDTLTGASDEEETDIEVVDLPAKMGDEEIDLTGASDDEVIAVFKKMSDEDEVEVVKDEDGIHLTDNETGAEYYIKEDYDIDEGHYGMNKGDEYHRHDVDGHEKEAGKYGAYMEEGEDSPCMHEAAGCGKHKHEGEDAVMYEIELEEGHYGMNKGDEYHRHDVDGHEKEAGKYGAYMEEGDDMEEGYDMDEGHYGMNKGDEYHRHDVDGHEKEAGKYGAYMEQEGDVEVDVDLDEEEVDESTRRTLADRRRRDLKPSNYPTNESRKPRTSKNAQRVSESKIMKEYKELKSKNEQYKGALKVFKNKLNEVALFNTNLAYVNRLFTEHSTTKSEKMEILKRFDGAESIKESKSIYKSVKGELETKKPITESVENRVNKTVKSSKSELNESTTYVDPQITAIKDLMRKIS